MTSIRASLDVSAELSKPVPDIIRRVGISEQTFYRWKKACSGHQFDQGRRFKQPQEESVQLKKMVAELSLDKGVLQDVLSEEVPGRSEA